MVTGVNDGGSVRSYALRRGAPSLARSLDAAAGVLHIAGLLRAGGFQHLHALLESDWTSRLCEQAGGLFHTHLRRLIADRHAWGRRKNPRVRQFLPAPGCQAAGGRWQLQVDSLPLSQLALFHDWEVARRERHAEHPQFYRLRLWTR